MEEEPLTMVHISLPNHWATDGESLWALPLGDDLYEIRNIPFYAYFINWGDVVKAPENEDQIPEVKEVVRTSGHETFRVVFDSKLNQEAQLSILSSLESFDLSWERCNDCYVALDLHVETNYDAVYDRLSELKRDEILAFETCEARVPGEFDAIPSQVQ